MASEQTRLEQATCIERATRVLQSCEDFLGDYLEMWAKKPPPLVKGRPTVLRLSEWFSLCAAMLFLRGGNLEMRAKKRPSLVNGQPTVLSFSERSGML